MTDLMWYLLEANVAMAVLYGCFKLVQPRLSFSGQRFSLLAVPVLATLAVFGRHWAAESGLSYRIPVVLLEPFEVGEKSPAGPEAFSFSVEWLYWCGVILLSFRTLFRTGRIVWLFLGHPRRGEDGCSIVEIPGRESFSFFRWVQLRSDLSPEDKGIVLQHEKVHVQKWHTADLLFLEAVHCIAWFNPLLILLKKDLVHVHEFEADRVMYGKYRVAYMEFLLSYSLGTSSISYSLTNQFLARLTLIKRIKNMKNTTPKNGFTAVVLPVVALVFSMVSWTATAQTGTAKQRPDKVYTEVDKIAEFPGGQEAFSNFLIQNSEYPESAFKAKIEGVVVVSFVVTETGKVTRVGIKKSVSPDLDAQSIRVVESMPDWTPAEVNGRKVSSELCFPFAYKLEEESK